MERAEPCAVLAGMPNGATAVNNGMSVPREMKHGMTKGSSYSTSDIYPNKERQILEQVFAHPSSLQHDSQ